MTCQPGCIMRLTCTFRIKPAIAAATGLGDVGLPVRVGLRRYAPGVCNVDARAGGLVR